MPLMKQWELRRDFAAGLSAMYGNEVPAYLDLVDTSHAVNTDYAQAHPIDAERLGDLDRVTAERHGAIRVGSPEEMAQVTRVFAAFGMHPVGFYDLRQAASAAVPVVSTAFRPVDSTELAKNPFRVFTSMLTVDDRQFFSPEMTEKLREFISNRALFGQELLELADRASHDKVLPEQEGKRLVELAVQAFELSSEPVDEQWYKSLEEISAVAADIGGVRSTHINHLTPRVLDIDDLYRRMEAQGITMIDEVQGPPAWSGPDVLLRQTSFRALEEQRNFRFADGTEGTGGLRVRFGEVEQRGIALTPEGRDLYDRVTALVDEAMEGQPRSRKPEIARRVWDDNFPCTERALLDDKLAYFTFQRTESADPASLPQHAMVPELIEQGLITATPIVYEDFLPRSAAGIFQSNLTHEGRRDNDQIGTEYSMDSLSDMIGVPIADPYALYQRQQDASLEALGIEITHS